MKKYLNRICLIICLGLLVCSNVSSAEPYSREGKGYEIFVFGQSMSGDETSGLGIDIAFENTNIWGAGGGHNGDYININMDVFFGYIGWSATGYDVSMTDQYFTIKGLDVNIDAFLMYQITPLATAGIGIMIFENDDIDILESNLSFNMGAGVRWDITEQIFVKGLYRSTWTKLENTYKSLRFGGISILVGYIWG
ncbi:MAG: outer membrane beta-barrel protein [Candidatus Marinimicrobia bacterium]|nr:outer membrane beta-barrel protein [Candidatus Neomarinimicrobiota bacterium]